MNIEESMHEHLVSVLEDLEGISLGELHEKVFLEDFFVVGYYNASELLKEWGIDPFEAISEVLEGAQELGQELSPSDINSETIVNRLIDARSYTFVDKLLESCGLDGHDYLNEETIEALAQ